METGFRIYELCHGQHKTQSSSIDDCLFSSLDPPFFCWVFIQTSFIQPAMHHITTFGFVHARVDRFFFSPILLVCTSCHSGSTYLPGFRSRLGAVCVFALELLGGEGQDKKRRIKDIMGEGMNRQCNPLQVMKRALDLYSHLRDVNSKMRGMTLEIYALANLVFSSKKTNSMRRNSSMLRDRVVFQGDGKLIIAAISSYEIIRNLARGLCITTHIPPRGYAR